jgi:hypothetical protein
VDAKECVHSGACLDFACGTLDCSCAWDEELFAEVVGNLFYLVFLHFVESGVFQVRERGSDFVK